jgi:hypothetical protein
LWLALGDPGCAELCAGAGFDWLLLDAEHGPNDFRTLMSQLQVLAPYEGHPVVRLREGDTNLVTKQPYRGMYSCYRPASMCLAAKVDVQTANELGGSPQERAEHHDRFLKDRREGKLGTRTRRRGNAAHVSVSASILRFNLEQCDLPQGVLDKLPKVETHKHDPIDAAELIVANTPQRPELLQAGSKAFHSSITDRVTMPARELFTSTEEYYARPSTDFVIMPTFGLCRVVYDKR